MDEIRGIWSRLRTLASLWPVLPAFAVWLSRFWRRQRVRPSTWRLFIASPTARRVPQFPPEKTPGRVLVALMWNFVPPVQKRRHRAPLGCRRWGQSEAGRPVVGRRRRWSATVTYCQRRALPYYGSVPPMNASSLAFRPWSAYGVWSGSAQSVSWWIWSPRSPDCAPGRAFRCECPLIPPRRLAQDEAVSIDDLRGKLAVGNDPTPQPEGGSRLMTQLLGMAIWREGDYYPLSRVAV